MYLPRPVPTCRHQPCRGCTVWPGGSQQVRACDDWRRLFRWVKLCLHIDASQTTACVTKVKACPHQALCFVWRGKDCNMKFGCQHPSSCPVFGIPYCTSLVSSLVRNQVPCGLNYTNHLTTGTSGFTPVVGGVLNPPNCNASAPATATPTHIGDVCISPFSVNWQCKLASWDQQVMRCTLGHVLSLAASIPTTRACC